MADAGLRRLLPIFTVGSSPRTGADVVQIDEPYLQARPFEALMRMD
jgi:hypothetical protein